MNKADMLIDVHPDLSEDDREKLVDEIITLNGVLQAHFDPRHPHGHGLYVEYDPDAIHAKGVLEEVKRWDPQADMASL
ncbi:MAG: hypothetical protein IME93_06855 [Proteobacteria bacterium]|nr:hypothetical protein [Pseudomonadota bacterium]